MKIEPWLDNALMFFIWGLIVFSYLSIFSVLLAN